MDRKEIAGKTFDLTLPRISNVLGKYPDGLLTKSEKTFLDQYFKDMDEHDFSSQHIEPLNLPDMAARIQNITSLGVRFFYGFKGGGPIGMHDDKGSDIDLSDSVAFVILVKKKINNIKYGKGDVLYSTHDLMLFLTGHSGQASYKNMALGQLMCFDPALPHGVMTSCSYCLLCGVLDLQSIAKEDEC